MESDGIETFQFDNKATKTLLALIMEHKDSILPPAYVPNIKNLKEAAWETVRMEMEIKGYKLTIRQIKKKWDNLNQNLKAKLKHITGNPGKRLPLTTFDTTVQMILGMTNPKINLIPGPMVNTQPAAINSNFTSATYNEFPMPDHSDINPSSPSSPIVSPPGSPKPSNSSVHNHLDAYTLITAPESYTPISTSVSAFKEPVSSRPISSSNGRKRKVTGEVAVNDDYSEVLKKQQRVLNVQYELYERQNELIQKQLRTEDMLYKLYEKKFELAEKKLQLATLDYQGRFFNPSALIIPNSYEKPSENDIEVVETLQ